MVLGTASHETRPFLELPRNISRKFLRRLKAESLKNCPRSSAETRIWGVLSKLDEHRYGRTPEPFREHCGTQTWKTRERLRTTSRVNLVLKQASSAPRLHITLARKMAMRYIVKEVNFFNFRVNREFVFASKRVHSLETYLETFFWFLNLLIQSRIFPQGVFTTYLLSNDFFQTKFSQVLE